ncbi:hypothetical protein KI387_027605 [Taxus chinensis]|uniref:Uncharacterized protein n=1 Tax=Taxus chinensis TaxID=29808 RepID=A0AA38FZB3_TAXCH|nr:hypothetical protein KI387_027605 [Taxus chinensis]
MLVEDVDVIDAGRVALPLYSQNSYMPEWLSSDQSAPEWTTSSKSPFSVRGPSKKASEQDRKKGVPWTEEERRNLNLAQSAFELEGSLVVSSGSFLDSIKVPS